MARRIEQVNILIQKEMGKIFLRELDFEKNILVTITDVETSLNLQLTEIKISVFPEKETKKILEFLNKNIYNFQQKLNQRLKMRPVPKISFSIESRAQSAAKIEELLEKIKNEN